MPVIVHRTEAVFIAIPFDVCPHALSTSGAPLLLFIERCNAAECDLCHTLAATELADSESRLWARQINFGSLMIYGNRPTSP